MCLGKESVSRKVHLPENIFDFWEMTQNSVTLMEMSLLDLDKRVDNVF